MACFLGQDGGLKQSAIRLPPKKDNTNPGGRFYSILTSGRLAPGAHPLLALSRLHSALLIDNLPDLGPVLDLQQDPLLGSSGMAS